MRVTFNADVRKYAIDHTCYKQALFQAGDRVAAAVEQAGATQLGG